jgi:hypothetical protein
MDPLLAQIRRSDLGTVGSVSWVPTKCVRERAIGGGQAAASIGEDAADRTERDHPPHQTSASSQQHRRRLRRYWSVTGGSTVNGA